MKRKLLDYLPNIMSVFAEFKEIARAEQIQVDDLWDAIEQLLNEKFLDTATANGVAKWEGILELMPKSSDSLEIRNLRIRAKLLEDLPYTEETLFRMLTALCGEDKFSMVLKNSQYTLVVRLKLEIKGLIKDAKELCERVTPLNIILDVSVMYNTHKVLSAYRHEQLSLLSQKGCREEEIEKWISFLVSQISLLEVDNESGDLYFDDRDGKGTGFEYNPENGCLYFDTSKVGGNYET